MDLSNFEKSLGKFMTYLTCPICHLVMSNPHTLTECGHHFCLLCIQNTLNRSNSCPVCQQQVRPKNLKRSPIHSNLIGWSKVMNIAIADYKSKAGSSSSQSEKSVALGTVNRETMKFVEDYSPPHNSPSISIGNRPDHIASSLSLTDSNYGSSSLPSASEILKVLTKKSNNSFDLERSSYLMSPNNKGREKNPSVLSGDTLNNKSKIVPKVTTTQISCEKDLYSSFNHSMEKHIESNLFTKSATNRSPSTVANDENYSATPNQTNYSSEYQKSSFSRSKDPESLASINPSSHTPIFKIGKNILSNFLSELMEYRIIAPGSKLNFYDCTATLDKNDVIIDDIDHYEYHSLHEWTTFISKTVKHRKKNAATMDMIKIEGITLVNLKALLDDLKYETLHLSERADLDFKERKRSPILIKDEFSIYNRSKRYRKSNGPRIIRAVFSGVSESDREQLVEKIKFFSSMETQITIRDHFDLGTTHLVVCTNHDDICKRTMKYLMALLYGVFVVKTEWILSSYKCGKILDEKDFIVAGDHIAGPSDGPIRSYQGNPPYLFLDVTFLLKHQFLGSQPSYEELVQFIHLGKGQIMSAVEESIDDTSFMLDKNESNDDTIYQGSLVILMEESFIKSHIGSKIKIPRIENKVGTNPKILVRPINWLLESISYYHLLPYHHSYM